ncbi:GH36-type glycosyl hydrolase domain-containing protein [Paludisphaera mucosa]|uniref:Glucoamylase family protein n=1 Tax=Paludisphaera mucosa TaxID=3030827 RepID=A0ABT6FK02_9BACT|nr:glucoamylase family protein [Paludisphaera mucosa]MDG3007912.1 glucoamylase family protein [Paludisphaera mucosa]
MSATYLGGPSSATATDGGEGAWIELLDPRRAGPIRGELLGTDRLERLARALAGAGVTARRRRAGSPLLKRFADNGKVLEQVHARIVAGDEHARGIDVEWLLDNFHIVDEVLKEVRRDMPQGYDAVLPKLAATPLKGYPRAYAIAIALAAHTDAEFDEARLNRFVAAFQQESPLTIGELWALPTMLRLVLLENLRRLAEEMVWSWRERRRADAWLAAAEAERPAIGEPSGPFVARLMQAPRAPGTTAPAAAAVHDRLKARGIDVDDLVGRENHRQAANQVTVGNSVVSLRLLSAVDWNAFFEQQSLVQKILLDDPSGSYALQDFATCDRCRKVVERTARGSKADELAVARRAVELAAGADPSDHRRRHVGYWLLEDGLKDLRASFPYRGPRVERLQEAARAHPHVVYFGSIVATWLVIASACVWIAGAASFGTLGLLAFLALLAMPVGEVAVGFINHTLTIVMPPKVLAKLEFKKGIPDEHRTFVVIPTMLIRPHHAAGLLERLEIHYLSNPDPNLRFALLTDFADAPSEHMPNDQALIDDALERVRALNARYASTSGGEDLFYIFHRRRLWNPSQGSWMGWERKRGKLSEFNKLLRGDVAGGSYDVFSVDPATLPHFRFVITLDSDTQMPRDTAMRLVGTIAHPLNRPRFDAASGRVVEGYGVLQPRVNFHLTAATHSYFARLLASGGGIDPYSTAASDSYMDLYGIGSFTGKGVYEVDAFERATGEIFPENRILSHDLIEGNYARCGLLSDTEVFDDFPARYHAYARREHRWIRGDWQLLPWLGPNVPLPGGKTRPNPLPTLERWKLLDNLRRSLVAPAIVLMLALGWTVMPGSPWLWTGVALLVLAQPVLKWLTATTVGAIRSASIGPFRGWWESVYSLGGQSLLSLAFLPDQARQAVDAIVRTLYRQYVSHERMLEWETAASTEQRLGGGLGDFVRSMWQAPAVAILILAAVAWLRPESLWCAAPILLAWLLSPLVAYGISRPLPSTEVPLGAEPRRALRRLARKTWRYFETFVGDEDHWLPPDNFQEVPDGRVAHRTSPTNKGLLLISTLSAHDLGFLSLGTMLDRLERTFDTLDRLERHWGHFYNWYQTQTLEALPPLYISTVDSGNLLGCLVALRQGLIEKAGEPIVGPAVAEGLADALNLALEVGGLDASRLRALLDAPPADVPGWRSWLDRVEAEAERLNDAVAAEAGRREGDFAAAKIWGRKLLEQVRDHRRQLDALTGGEAFPAGAAAPTLKTLAASRPAAAVLAGRLSALADRADAMGREMDFRPLYKKEKHLYAIGCNLSQGRLDGACYDLLASESCLTSYLTIARGEAPRKHWFQLGRPFVRAAGRIGLISWGGTMFEYLMPRLLLKSLSNTVLSEACRAAVARQIEYGGQLGLPWGISESAFSAQYADGDYRYQAFGAPGLGIKQGLDEDRVIAPYATAMATMIAPAAAVENLKRLTSEGAEGPFGWYEAVDYTPSRLAPGQHSVVVRSYMSHHQGMSLVAAANVVLGDLMPRRFHAEPMVRAAELLLQERVPRDTPLVDLDADYGQGADAEGAGGAPAAEQPPAPSFLSRRLTTPATAAPRTHLLSNAQYHVMITNAGAGASSCRGFAVTRWREDPAREAYGQFLYIRDVASGLVWSAGFQPVCRPADEDEIVFAADKATFRRRDGSVESLLEVTVSPEQFAEVRRLTLFNHGSKPRELDVTSYAEVVLARHDADLAHPAFHKLFLETEWLPGSAALLCRRRPRSPHEEPLWAVHVLAVDGSSAGCTLVGEATFETDRERFLGRGRTVADPAALDPGEALSGSVGPVLDPIFSLRRRLTLAPGGTVVLAFTTAVAENRAGAVALADQYHGPSASARAFEMAWAHRQAENGQRGWSAEEAHLFQRLASHLIFAGPALRARPPAPDPVEPAPRVLARHGVGLGLPIVLARIADAPELSLARQLMAGQAYLRLKGLEFDLVFLDDAPAPGLGGPLDAAAREVGVAGRVNQPGGIHVVPGAALDPAARGTLAAAARVILDAADGPLADQLEAVDWSPELPELLTASPPTTPRRDEPVTAPDGLLFPNGLGGFTPDGREYCILIDTPGRPDGNGASAARQPLPRPALAPLPWSNVIANPTIGFLVTEGGSQATWAGNSQANRLTAWSNDPVSDPSAEVVYLRDEEAGQVWCPTPLPIPSAGAVLVRHGQGRTTFERNSHGIEHRLDVYVDPERPVKYLRLRLKNPGTTPRKLSATFYAEWVLGTTRDRSAMHVVTAVDAETGALTARNALREDFAAGVAFLDVDRRPRTVTGDRGEFLGRHGSIANPSALGQVALSGRVGAGLDPCGAVQTKLDLGPGESLEVVFLLGWADAPGQVRELLAHVRNVGAAAALEGATARWDELLGAVQVRTPEPSFDLLINRWLLYQTTSCRLWGRTAFSQSGGAFGFRDQLQDALALLHAAPGLAREQVLLHASRQFVEGDVQHWWHPPAGRGVRTRYSDDYLWLPFVASRYVETTGDRGVLDVEVPFLEAPALAPGQEDDYRLPSVASAAGSLYEHCVRALDRSSPRGAHGLPLMGGGDWNDGMNRVGVEGKGESVWLAWFLSVVLRRFAPIAEARGDADRARRWRSQADALVAAAESHAWDGGWYRRAYFDDGSPLGSAANAECRIDSLAQSWSVFAGADASRSARALDAVEAQLVREADRLVLLLAPPFDRSKPSPGYIQGYVPGTRENGAQYTHAAAWVVQAAAGLGRGESALKWFEHLDPIRHTLCKDDFRRYKGEPYALAGDVFGKAPHLGRVGWTWYTGAAGWLYQAGLESILGVRRRGDRLSLDPRIPSSWERFQVDYRFGATRYEIHVLNPDARERGRTRVAIDGVIQETAEIPLVDDGRHRYVEIVMFPLDDDAVGA